MGLNCEAGQTAEVVKVRYGTDEEQLLGQRVHLVAATYYGKHPSWLIDPPLVITTTGAGRVGSRFFEHGEQVHVRVLPDFFLRPVEPQAETPDRWRECVAGADDQGSAVDPHPATE